jgi:hypothetical protein
MNGLSLVTIFLTIYTTRGLSTFNYMFRQILTCACEMHVGCRSSPRSEMPWLWSYDISTFVIGLWIRPSEEHERVECLGDKLGVSHSIELGKLKELRYANVKILSPFEHIPCDVIVYHFESCQHFITFWKVFWSPLHLI